MHFLYNRVAGQSVERLAALSDGIFAVAMTLLVLDLRVPGGDAVHSERELWRILLPIMPRLLIFFMSVMTLGIFWVGQQTQLNHFARADRNLSWIHISFLCAVSLVPFSTSLFAEYIHYRTALLIYWSNVLLLGLTLYWSWSYAVRVQLLSDDVPPEVHPAVVRRIVIAQSLYAGGASLCFINTYWSIAASELCHRSTLLLGNLLAKIGTSALKVANLPGMDFATPFLPSFKCVLLLQVLDCVSHSALKSLRLAH